MEVDNKAQAPCDKWKRVYIIFYWLGICTLLPWNFFISVPGYWFYKYRPVNINETESSSESLTDLQISWNPRLSVASMVPNVTFLILNAVFGHRFKTRPRLLFSLVIVIILFVFTCTMAKVNTDDWQNIFFNVTLVSVVCINIFAAIFQGGLLGVAGKFPSAYIGGVFSGQALGGIFASATNIVMLALGASDQNSGFFSFIIACIFLALSLVAFLFVTKTDFYKYYDGEMDGPNVLEVNPDGDKLMEKAPPTPENSSKVNPLLVLRDIWVYALSVFLVFAVTLGCFPGITAAIKSTGTGTWSTKFFIPVTCFLTFNIGDYVGRSAAEFLQFPKPNVRGASIYVLIASLLRVVFIPLFIICNVSPTDRHVTSVVFESDTVYIILMILFSISNGYVSSICMMSAPGITKRPEEQATAASLMVACLGLGLGVGAGLSNVLVLLL